MERYREININKLNEEERRKYDRRIRQLKAEIKKLKTDDWFYRSLFAIRWPKQIYPEIWERKQEIKRLKEERKKGKELEIEEPLEPRDPKEMYIPAEKYIKHLISDEYVNWVKRNDKIGHSFMNVMIIGMVVMFIGLILSYLYIGISTWLIVTTIGWLLMWILYPTTFYIGFPLSIVGLRFLVPEVWILGTEASIGGAVALVGLILVVIGLWVSHSFT